MKISNDKFSRLEFKYLMTDKKAGLVLDQLKKYGMRPDPKALSFTDCSYVVNSIYFDSWDWQDYQDKVGGFLSRKKIRLRAYTNDFREEVKDVWLEIKKKHDMAVFKERIQFFNGSHALLKEPFFKIIENFSKNNSLSPVPIFNDIMGSFIKKGVFARVLVRYQRTPLVFGASNNLRITFDSNIEACKTDSFLYNKPMISVKKGITVMELKYNLCIPKWFGDVVHRFGLQRDAFSKYALSVEAINKYKSLPI